MLVPVPAGYFGEVYIESDAEGMAKVYLQSTPLNVQCRCVQ